MIQITEQYKCCGCSACQTICPQHCIDMKEDKEGFLYPFVYTKHCINCKLCEKVCPVLNPIINNNAPIKSYTIINKDKDILKESASGGSFTPLAEYTISNGGYVFGAAYDNNLQVCHQFVNSTKDLKKFRGSKYVQSNINSSYIIALSLLKEGYHVLFSGTPCQIQGLYKIIKHTKIDASNLITLDFACHGVPSPKVFRKYLEYISNKYEAKVLDYKFRTKKYGYKSYNSYCCIKLSNNKEIWADKKEKYNQFMFNSFFSEITSRPSCSKCAFKSKHHITDFTVFDCWHWKQLNKDLNGDMGATNLIINTTKGYKIFKEIQNKFDYEESNLELAIKYDGISMLHSIPSNPRRTSFFTLLDNMTIPELHNLFLEPTWNERLINYVKLILEKSNLLPLLRNFKYKINK